MAAPGTPPSPSLRLPLLRTGLLLGAVIAGATAQAGPDGASFFGVRGPRCPLGACFGEATCPGCGLLRSTAAALQGNFADAYAMHPTGVAVAALLLAGLLVHFDILRRRHELSQHRRLRHLGHIVFPIALAVGWLLRLLRS